MGLFDWLKAPKSNVEILDDSIWLTKAAKFDGIRRQVARLFAEPDAPEAVILAAHFPDCFGELQKIIDAGGFSGSVTATTVDNLRGATASGLVLDESHLIQLIVGERHPLHAHDKAVVEFARSLPCRCRVVYYVSLEDGLMRTFAGEWVETVLKQPTGQRRVRRRVVYRGRVQGVGFRFTTVSIARHYPVEGYVKNLPEGTVEVVVEGEPEAIEPFLEEVADAFRGSIRDVTSELLEPTEEFASFEVRH